MYNNSTGDLCSLFNGTSNCTTADGLCVIPDPSYQDHPVAKLALGLMYGLVFVTAVCGNSLVIYVVASNSNMQSVTNIFIANLAVSDIIVNFTSLWVTPVYTYLGRWAWGTAMCHTVPLVQGSSIFISVLTLTAIAVDRYIVILFPFKTRMSTLVCVTVIVSIWLLSILLVTPLALRMKLAPDPNCPIDICQEEWSDFPQMRMLYGWVVMALQFIVPFIIIAFCYTRIWIHLKYRQSMIVSRSSSSDERRKRRLLKMLICMVVIFALCWLPVNTLNVLRDGAGLDGQNYFVILFLMCHWMSMTTTCWNPILYAWMNDNFRREFQAVLPFFRRTERIRRTLSFTNGRRSTGAGNSITGTRTFLAPENSVMYPGNGSRIDPASPMDFEEKNLLGKNISSRQNSFTVNKNYHGLASELEALTKSNSAHSGSLEDLEPPEPPEPEEQDKTNLENQDFIDSYMASLHSAEDSWPSLSKAAVYSEYGNNYLDTKSSGLTASCEKTTELLSGKSVDKKFQSAESMDSGNKVEFIVYTPRRSSCPPKEKVLLVTNDGRSIISTDMNIGKSNHEREKVKSIFKYWHFGSKDIFECGDTQV